MRPNGFKRQAFWATKKADRNVKAPTQETYAIVRKWLKTAQVGVYDLYEIIYALPSMRKKGKSAYTYHAFEVAVRAFEKYGAVRINRKLYVI
jgi:hypothetical protein